MKRHKDKEQVKVAMHEGQQSHTYAPLVSTSVPPDTDKSDEGIARSAVVVVVVVKSHSTSFVFSISRRIYVFI